VWFDFLIRKKRKSEKSPGPSQTKCGLDQTSGKKRKVIALDKQGQYEPHDGALAPPLHKSKAVPQKPARRSPKKGKIDVGKRCQAYKKKKSYP